MGIDADTSRRGFIALAASGVAVAAMPKLSRGAAEPSAARREPIRGRVICGDAKVAAGVTVSDGLVCVQTAADGGFELPYREGARFLSVTTPSGWRTDWPHLALPRKYQKYEFPLSRDPQTAGDGCSFVHIADSEISRPHAGVQAWMDRVKRIADDAKAAFIVHTGDICRRPGLVTHQRMMNDWTMGRKVVYCIGNHDLEVGPSGESMFENLYGPCWYSFEAGGVHFCVTPMPTGDYRPSYTMDDIADWLRNDLALVPKSRPVVVFNHMISNWGGKSDEVGFVFGKERPIDLRKACNFAGFVYGHVHNNRFRRVGQIAQISTANPNMGGIDHAPESIRVVKVAKGGFITSHLHYGHDDSPRKSTAKAVWEADVGAPVLYGEPVVADGKGMVGVSDEDGLGRGAVVAFDATSGREVWRARTEGSVRNRMVAMSGVVVAQDGDGRVYGFRISDGAAAWKADLGISPWMVLSSGLAADAEKGVVFAGDGRRLSALDAATGRKVWSGGGWKGDAGDACADSPGLGEGVLVFGANWQGVHANDAATGRHLWVVKNRDIRFTGATPYIADGKVYVLGGKKFFELDLRTGEILREVAIGSKVDLPTKVVDTGRFFVFGTENNGLLALDKKTLAVAWSGEVGDSLTAVAGYSAGPKKCVNTVPVLFGGGRHIVAACADGTVRVWDATDGRTLKVFDTGRAYLSGCAVCGDVAYAADIAGKVRAFALKGA